MPIEFRGKQVAEPTRMHSYGCAPLTSGGVRVGVGEWQPDENAIGERWLGSRIAVDGERRFAGPLALEHVTIYDLDAHVIAPATLARRSVPNSDARMHQCTSPSQACTSMDKHAQAWTGVHKHA